MKERKFEYSLIFVILIMSIILFLAYSLIDMIINRNKYTIITNPLYVITCKKDKCQVNEDYIEYLKGNYFGYINGSIYNKSKISYDEGLKELHVMDKTGNILNKKTDNVLLSNKNSIRVINTEMEEIGESELSSLNLLPGYTYGYGYKVVLDFDNDLSKETLYYVYLKKNKTAYSAIIYKDDLGIQRVAEYTSESELATKTYIINNILDLTNDGNIEFISEFMGSDSLDYCMVLYELDNGEFKPKNECKIVNY